MSNGSESELLRWSNWRHVPREARDTLFLLFVIAWTMLPHLSHLPWWCSALASIVLLWRAHLAVYNAPLPSRWIVTPVLAAAVGLTWWSQRTLLGKEAGVTLLVVLMALKTLELRARRDAFVVFFLGFFLVLTQFLYSQTLLTAVAMIVAVWGLLTSLVLAHMPAGRPHLRQAGAVAARAAVFGMPLMVLLFALFPRMEPLWGVPADAVGRTGLSSTMKMGSMAEIANDDSIAMRLHFAGSPPPVGEMYFRGPVLSDFDGREWKQPETPPFGLQTARGDSLRVRGKAYPYELTLEPARLPVLPLLEAAPDDMLPRAEGYSFLRRTDLQWMASRPLTERLRVDAVAYVDFEYGPRSNDPALRRYVQLPSGYNPRTLAWAAALRAQPAYAEADAATLAAAVLGHVRSGGFTYTLAPGTYGDVQGRHAIDEFWLDRKEGFCEHFAASFVIVMRALGVPARIVTGYQGADMFPVDGYVIVRQSNAHAWAEYWQAGRGWVRADPTAAVAPDRIARGASLQPRPGIVAGALNSVSPALLSSLRQGWELLNNRWNQWVLSYTRTKQFDLLRRIGINEPRWEDLAFVLLGVLVALSSAGAAWAWWDRHRMDPWERLHERMCRALLSLGVPAAAHHAPRTLAGQVRSHLGSAGETLAAMLDTLDRARYGRGGSSRIDAALARRFDSEAARLRRNLQPR